MIALQEPTNLLVVLTHNYKQLKIKSPIEHRIADLIDIVTIRLRDKPIEIVANSVLEKIFDLRFDVISWFFEHHQNKNIFQTFQVAVNTEIATKLQAGMHAPLAKTIARVLEVYSKILSPFSTQMLDTDLNNVSKNFVNNRVSYAAFAAILTHPSPQIQYLKHWTDASLKLEFGLIVADLVLTEKIQLSKAKVTQLQAFLIDMLIQFGAYSIFTQYWIPDANDDSPLTNSMDILASTIELENKIAYRTTQDNLYHLIHN